MPLAPPAPPPWFANQYPQPADMNAHVRDDLTFLTKRTVFRAWQSTAAPQSIPNNAVTVLTLDTVIEDSYSGWTAGAGTNKYTAQEDGMYLIAVGYYSNAGNGAGHVANAFVIENGATTTAGQQEDISTTTNWGTVCVLPVYLRAGTDYVQPAAAQTSGAALNTVSVNVAQASYMEIVWISR